MHGEKTYCLLDLSKINTNIDRVQNDDLEQNIIMHTTPQVKFWLYLVGD